jgi:response regulator RpfG family c-di-GMP phosphodiesterase
MRESEYKITILVAYNDENVTLLLKTIIDFKFNAKIDIAQNDFEFVKLTANNRYDIVFMGDTFTNNTFSFINEFKEKPVNSDTHLILFASYVAEMIYKKSLEADIYDFLLKPFNLVQIYSLVNQILYKKGLEEELSTRRRYVRIKKKLPIRYSLFNNLQECKVESQIVNLENICVGGLYFKDNQDFNKGDSLIIKIPLVNPFDKDILNIAARIIWVKEIDNFQKKIGAEFLDMKHTDKLKLSHALYSF